MPTIAERKQPNFELDGHVKRIEMRETIFGKTKTETTEKQKGGITEFFFFRWVGLYFSTLVNAERIHTKEKKTFTNFNAPSLKRKKKKDEVQATKNNNQRIQGLSQVRQEKHKRLEKLVRRL